LVPQQAKMPKPIVAATNASRVHAVDRTENSLVHSERMTRGSVLPPAWSACVAACEEGAAVWALTAAPPVRW